MTSASPAPRRRAVARSDGLEAVLTWYPPGAAMALHAHAADQQSLLLAGSFEEETASRKVEVLPGASGFKPAGLRHANVYGRDGALILALNGCGQARPGAGWRWRSASSTSVRSLAGLLLETGPEAEDALVDCTAVLAEDDTSAPLQPAAPLWLRDVKARIDADPASARADALARGAGVHRVHLSRRFAAAFGAPLSVYRRRVMVARAVRGVLHDGAPASAAANEAGFCDQAHFIRTLKTETGCTPARLKALLAAA